MTKLKYILSVLLLLLSTSVVNAQKYRPPSANISLKGSVKSMGTYIYGQHGRVIMPPSMMFFNEDGYVTTSYICDTTGKAELRMDFTYDKQGRLISMVQINQSLNKQIQAVNYVYNKKDKTMTAQTHVEGDSVDNIVIYTFNDKDQIVQAVAYDEAGAPIATTYNQYDQYGNLTSTVRTEGEIGRYAHRETYRHDTEGNLVLKSSHSLGRLNQQIFYIYEFDSNDNWVKCYAFRVKEDNAELFETTVRYITYF